MLPRDNQGEKRIASSRNAPERVEHCLTRMLPAPCQFVNGGRQKGSTNKATVEREELIAEASQRATSELTQEQIAEMSPLEVMLHAMKLEVANARWGVAAALAEKAAPYIHPRLASEVHRVFNDDSKRATAELQRELADLDRAAEIAAKAGTVETGVPGKSNGVVH